MGPYGNVRLGLRSEPLTEGAAKVMDDGAAPKIVLAATAVTVTTPEGSEPLSVLGGEAIEVWLGPRSVLAGIMVSIAVLSRGAVPLGLEWSEPWKGLYPRTVLPLWVGGTKTTEDGLAPKIVLAAIAVAVATLEGSEPLSVDGGESIEGGLAPETVSVGTGTEPLLLSEF